MRTKHVFRTAEVAHIWAQQRQESGRNARGNIYFEGKSIFSYGSHFEMARFVRPDVVLRTTRGYSVTTAKHLRYVASALSESQSLFTVPTFDDHTANAEYLAKVVRDTIDRTSRAHAYIGLRLQTIASETKTALAYLSLFKKDIRKGARKGIRDLDKYFHKILTQDKIDALKAREIEKQKRDAIKNKERAARREEENRKRAEEAKGALEDWKAGLGYGRSWSFQYLPVALRIQEDRIETSHGASIPLSAARELWDKLTKNEPVHGMTLGDYTVVGLSDGVLVVGCHKIPLLEVYRMARGLGWMTKEVTL